VHVNSIGAQNRDNNITVNFAAFAHYAAFGNSR
jgi:hypothetical protein